MLVATSIPNPPVPSALARFDKVVHFAMYALLAGLLAWAAVGRLTTTVVVLASVLAVAAWGAIDEWHQQFIPGRSMDLNDWLADLAGALAGATVTMLALRARPTSPR